MLAEVELEAGKPEAALATAEELISWGRENAELYVMADLLRIKGLCLRARGQHSEAEAVLREALGTARAQGARMLELRAAIALSELLREQGRPAEARQMLAPLVKEFTEGLDSPELVRAQGLLGELAA
jgi:ATP/maltotriose-dependent transcriptional regulator MalT